MAAAAAPAILQSELSKEHKPTQGISFANAAASAVNSKAVCKLCAKYVNSKADEKYAKFTELLSEAVRVGTPVKKTSKANKTQKSC